jgi:flagellar biogenesis protein FliO
MLGLNVVAMAALLPGFALEDVKLRTPGDDVTFVVSGDDTADAASVDVQRADHALLVVLRSASLKRPRVFSSPTGYRVWARANRGSVELQLPLDGAARCVLPARVRTEGANLTITVRCPPAIVAPPLTIPAATELPKPAPVVAAPVAPRTTVGAAPAPTPPAPAPAAPVAAASLPAGSLWGFVALAVLAGAAFYLSKKRQLPTGMLEVVQTQAMGPRRSLVVARLGHKTLLLSSSESGIQLVSELGEGGTPLLQVPAQQAAFANVAATGQAQGMQRQAFEQALEEVGEDQLLRQKLRLVKES